MFDDYKKKGLDRTATAISDVLGKRGLAGSAILELGCGVGGLTLELVRKGAASAIGIDLSSKMTRLARSLASQAGFSESTSFQTGDGAEIRLTRSDIVILDAVLC
jgi:cyclopropane fatty-acyl-phospholipid synthase-like methyltransferase